MVHVPLIFLSDWREFPSVPCFAEKNLMTACVSVLFKSRSSTGMLPFSLCSKKRLAIRHMNRPLFPTTLSISSYDIGEYVGLRTYQHPLVCVEVGLKYKLQHTGSRSAVAWQPRSLCYRPSVFLLHLHFTVFEFPQVKFWRAFKQVIISFFLLFKNCVFEVV